MAQRFLITIQTLPFGIHWLAFSPSTLRWVPVFQVSVINLFFLHHFVLVKLATSSIRVNNSAAGDQFCHYDVMQKILKMTKTLAHGYSFESTQWELSNEYQYDRVKMLFNRLCVLVLWTKVPSTMEGLRYRKLKVLNVMYSMNLSSTNTIYIIYFVIMVCFFVTWYWNLYQNMNIDCHCLDLVLNTHVVFRGRVN